MKKSFLFGSLLLAGLAASCNDERVSEAAMPESGNVQDVVYSVRLVDAEGTPITTLNGDFNQVYAEVEAEGDWYLSTQNSNYVYLTTKVGHGNSRVPVFVTTCWAEARDFSIQATPLSDYGKADAPAATRAAASTTQTTDLISQSAAYDLTTIANRLSSNLGAGYSVSTSTTNNILLKTQLQLFNLKALKELGESRGITLLKDDLSPQMEQKYIESNSHSSLRKQVTVGIKGNLDSGKLQGSGLSGNVNVADDSDSSAYYAVRRQLSKLFTRDIDYATLASLDDSVRGKALAPGFRMMRDSLQAQLLRRLTKPVMTAADSTACYELVEIFVREVGPVFICKASMGCALDYYIKVDSSSMDKGFTVHAVLDLKYESQVKDTATNVTKDSTKFTANATADVINKANKAAGQSEVEVVINGGDVSQVDVLCNGGSLTTADIQKWQQSISPDMSVMVEMEVVPISALFWNEDVKRFIFKYLKVLGYTE